MFLPTGHRVNGFLPLVAGVDGTVQMALIISSRVDTFVLYLLKINDNVIFVVF